MIKWFRGPKGDTGPAGPPGTAGADGAHFYDTTRYDMLNMRVTELENRLDAMQKDLYGDKNVAV